MVSLRLGFSHRTYNEHLVVGRGLDDRCQDHARDVASAHGERGTASGLGKGREAGEEGPRLPQWGDVTVVEVGCEERNDVQDVSETKQRALMNDW